MSSFFIGLEYVGAAFGICLAAALGGAIAWRGARLIIRQRIDASNAAAVEGDDRNFRLRPDGTDQS